MAITPITPDEAGLKKLDQIPDAIVESFNELIVENLRSGSSKFTQDEVLDRIRKKMGQVNYSTQTIFDQGWLDVEPLYRKVGWSVSYDKPAYNESYKATFEFSKPRIAR